MDAETVTDGRIVAIGASAGGLESLEQLFSSIPLDTGLAFVVVQHLSPDFRSLMDELIARHSEMPVVIAEDGMAVQANRIYLMPPRKEMIIRDRHLWLTDKEPHTFSLPIDAFFRSLAQDTGPQAVAIVLSGSGSDGSRGIVDVKRAGGVVLAESPASAKFDGMPVAAAAQHKISELKELNSDMAHLIEGTDVGTVFLDRELRIRRFTARIANVFRFQHHDIGRRIGDFSHNIERSQLMEEIEAALQRGTVIEDDVRDRSGTPYFLRILPYRIMARTNGNGNAHHDTPIDGVVLTLTDMTALDKARTRVEQLSAIVEWSDDAIMGLDLDGTITSWNRGAEKRYGYVAAEAIGKNVAMLLDAEHANALPGYLADIEAGNKVEHTASLCRHRDGSTLDLSVMISPIYAQSRVVGAAAIARDISSLTETQRALVEEQSKVKTLLQRREEFLAMLSHELRNPLAAVLNATAVLEQDNSAHTSARCHGVVKRQAAHMKRLLDDLLDVSRITTDKFFLDSQPCDLRDAIDTAVESTAPLYAQLRVRLERDIPERGLPLRGDARRLTQVIANLLSNAASYSPAESVVVLSAKVEGTVISLRVRDEGEGIAADLRPKIFDLFVQSEQKLDRSRGGLGVGLSLAKTIVEHHGGTIEVRSTVGQGSEFIVCLPLAHTRAPIIERLLEPRRIVVVDDQEDSREMLRELFEARNHTVFDAADGERAVALIAEHKPDIAFIDIGLPVMNGFEVAQLIRQRPDLVGVKLVALSGYGNTSDVKAALEAGFDEHVTKPAELAKLEQLIASRRQG